WSKTPSRGEDDVHDASLRFPFRKHHLQLTITDMAANHVFRQLHDTNSVERGITERRHVIGDIARLERDSEDVAILAGQLPGVARHDPRKVHTRKACSLPRIIRTAVFIQEGRMRDEQLLARAQVLHHQIAVFEWRETDTESYVHPLRDNVDTTVRRRKIDCDQRISGQETGDHL